MGEHAGFTQGIRTQNQRITEGLWRLFWVSTTSDRLTPGRHSKRPSKPPFSNCLTFGHRVAHEEVSTSRQCVEHTIVRHHLLLLFVVTVPGHASHREVKLTPTAGLEKDRVS